MVLLYGYEKECVPDDNNVEKLKKKFKKSILAV